MGGNGGMDSSPTPDEAEAIQARLDFIGLGDSARSDLISLKPLIEAEVHSALEAFYRKASEFPATRSFFADPAVAAHARAKQAAHWSIIASAQFDEDYAQAVRAVGHTHARLGLSPRWYLGGYALVTEWLVRAIVAEGGYAENGVSNDAGTRIASLLKAVFFDIDLGISTYLDALEERRQREEAARIEAERNQTIVVRALAETLARVASGDFEATVEQEFSTEYDQLKADFNGALQSLAQAHGEARAASQAKSDFLSNISHEIRTPLNGVIGVVGALSATSLSDQQSQMVELIRISAETVERLLTDVLDVSKIEAGGLRLECSPFNLNRVVQGAVGLFSSRAAEKGISLELQVDPSADVWLSGDAIRLSQVVSNLVSNAVKFTASGGVEVGLTAALEADGSMRVRLTVADSGIGFEEGSASLLFDRFSQADSSISRRYGGTGLGLSICKGIVETMGGVIEATSRPGHGSEFRVVIPFERQSPPGDNVNIADFDRKKSDEYGRIKVLLVEDHPVNRQIVRILLDPFGVDIVEAENGLEAVTAYKAQSFDVVLMDMQMPVMDGVSATRAIREIEIDQGRERVQIKILTANVSDIHRTMAMESGADEFLSKPIQRDKLLASIFGNFDTSLLEQ